MVDDGISYKNNYKSFRQKALEKANKQYTESLLSCDQKASGLSKNWGEKIQNFHQSTVEHKLFRANNRPC